ncbi:MAG: hypothetical protein IAG13_26995 [Deltaproteobacteria bacterium]|nr:hypothetical protein [Nannocystaceae bacterium]
MAGVGTSIRALLAASIVIGAVGCKSRSSHRQLFPPDDAPAWAERFAGAFDDDYTAADLELQGRAAHDVLDQRLFAARLGYAALIVLVRVEQVWGKGRYQGKKTQFLDVELGEVLYGELPKGTESSQLLEITGEDDVPGDLQGKDLVLFVRWAPGAEPPYHHHLMPAIDDIVAYIRSLVKHARDEGQLDKRAGKRKRKGAKGEAEAEPAGGPEGRLERTSAPRGG